MNQLPGDVTDLKDELERLASDRRWGEIRDRLAEFDDVALTREPKIAFHLAEALIHLANLERALNLSLAAEAEFRSRHDSANLMAALNLSGAIQFELGDLTGAEERFSDLLELARERADEEMSGRATNNLGTIASLQGDHERALSLYRLAVPAYQRAGHVSGLAQTAHNLGITYRDLGRWREARRQYQRAIKGAKRIGDRRLTAMATTAKAELMHRRGDHLFAQKEASRALEEFVAIEDELGRADTLRVLGGVAAAVGDAGAANERFDEALGLARDNANLLLEAEILEERGTFHAAEERSALARADFEAAATIYRRLAAFDRVRRVEEQIESLDL